MARAFLTGVMGTGARDDPWRPNVDLTGASWATWDLEHPDTLAIVGFIVLSGHTVAPDGAVDLGDPLDSVSMRTTKITAASANQISDLLGINANRIRNMSGAQVIRFLNRKDPVMAAEFADFSATLVDETDP